jgi:hypothetical protein
LGLFESSEKVLAGAHSHLSGAYRRSASLCREFGCCSVYIYPVLGIKTDAVSKYEGYSLMRNRWTSLLINVGLVVISLTATVLLVEVILPFLNIRTIEEAVYQARRPVVQGIYGAYHPEIAYTLQKNLRNERLHYPGQLDYTINTNKYGFRGPDWDLSPERKNVVVLGDSFAFGWGVAWEETVGSLLEKELRKSDLSYQVINLAMSGWDMDLIIQAFELYKDMLKPVDVVYVFCPNDLLGNIKKTPLGTYDIEYRSRPGGEETFKKMVARQQPGHWSWNRFYRSSYGKAYHARIIRPLFSKRIRKSLSIDPAPGGYDFPPPIEPPAQCTLDEEAKEFFLYCLNRLCDGMRGARLFILDTSDKSILYRKDRPDNRRWLVREFSLSKKNVVFTDFETFVRKTPDGREFYLDFDDHWSPQGHAAAAKMLLTKWAE